MQKNNLNKKKKKTSKQVWASSGECNLKAHSRGAHTFIHLFIYLFIFINGGRGRGVEREKRTAGDLERDRGVDTDKDTQTQHTDKHTHTQSSSSSAKSHCRPNPGASPLLPTHGHRRRRLIQRPVPATAWLPLHSRRGVVGS